MQFDESRVCNHRNHNKSDALQGKVRYDTLINGEKKWVESQKIRCQCCCAWFHIQDCTIMHITSTAMCDLCFRKGISGLNK